MDEPFRFQNLDIWQRAAAISRPLFTLSDEIEARKKFRWAEQLRSAVLSITNNIAEGSGSYSKAEFAQFLNFARRSVFETANILIQLSDDFLGKSAVEPLLAELSEISRMIHAFRKTLI